MGINKQRIVMDGFNLNFFLRVVLSLSILFLFSCTSASEWVDGNRKYGVNNHLNPEEAFKVGMDINANVFVGMPWRTIELSDEPPWVPHERFRNAARQSMNYSGRIWIMKIGETRLLPNSL